MSEQHTIKTNSSRKLYVPYYAMFIAILVASVYLSFQGRLTISALGAAAVIVFIGINVTEIHRIWQSYEVNPGAVVHTKGIITKHSKRIDLFAINTVTVHQNLYHRIFNIGNIHIHVANASHQTVLKNLHAPKVFAQTIQNNMHQARSKQFFEEDESDYSNTQQSFKRPKKDDLFDQPDEENDVEIFDNLKEI